MRLIHLLFVYCVLALPASAGGVKILLIGDSLASGYGLEADDGFSPALERALGEIGVEAHVINAGIAGDTSAGALARAAKSYGVEHDLAIIEIGANDMLRGVPPDVLEANLSSLVNLSEKPVFILGFQAMPSLGKSYADKFNAVYADVAKAEAAGFYPFVLAPLFAQGAGEGMKYFQADSLHPNAEGITIVTKALAPSLKAWIDSLPATTPE